jgi:hypothetical protein
MQKNRLFTLPVNEDTAIGDTSGRSATGSFVSKYLVAHYQKIAALDKDLTRLPEEEEFFFLQSDNSFNAFTFIPLICKTVTIKHLYATTYSINKRVITALMELHRQGVVDKITLLVSDTMIRRNPATADLLASANLEYPNLTVLFAWVHAKVCLIETNEANYVIEGSGNWSENAYYEQYVFANSKGLYDFRMQLFTEVEIRYKAIQGTIIKN